jgi:plastocyanin
MEEGKGLRAVGFACLILSATVAAPTLSIAQDPGAPPAPPGGASASPAPASQPGIPGSEAEDVPEDEDGASASPAPASQPGTPGGEAEDVPAYGEAAPVAAPAAPPKLAKASAATVSVGDNFFSPESVSIFAGESITWRNDGQAQHSATANDGSFDTGVFGPGSSRSESFSSPGTFSYYCVVHGLSQSGTVTVASASGGDGGGGGGNSGSAGADTSEAGAVASPSAAGSSTSLPSTGLAAIGLALLGLMLLASGIGIGRVAARDGAPEDRRLFSIY